MSDKNIKIKVIGKDSTDSNTRSNHYRRLEYGSIFW